MVRITYLAIFFVIFSLAFSPLKALTAGDGLNLPKTSINPDMYLLYSVKRLGEKILLFTKLTKESKANYYKDLTQIRLAELKYVVEGNLSNEVERSTQRLSYQIGILSDYVRSNKSDLSGKMKTTDGLLGSYKELLSYLRDKYPANSSYWMLIQHNINTIDLNREKLN